MAEKAAKLKLMIDAWQEMSVACGKYQDWFPVTANRGRGRLRRRWRDELDVFLENRKEIVDNSDCEKDRRGIFVLQ